jgi:phosphoribosylaminoimidazolecarboxamide formyltransferase/IMP cyclohydrolase
MNLKRALISVSDKTGVVHLSRALVECGFEILSTGGTARLLRDNHIGVKEVSEVTGFPELFDGRVKTLHPSIYGGILASRDNPEHLRQLVEHNMAEIDIVIVNLYPFRETSRREGINLEGVIESIDIGGVALLRAAAKNYRSVTALVDPADYEGAISELRRGGQIPIEMRARLAVKAFQHTSDYDFYISNYLERALTEPPKFPSILRLRYRKVEGLRYGENPHQAAALYRDEEVDATSTLMARQIQGKPLSYNNFLDLDCALNLLREFKGVTACIMKHTNPCGVAMGPDALEAYTRAYECDPASAYGGVIGVNCEVDRKAADQIVQRFYEAIIAPGFGENALQALSGKKNLTVLDLGKGAKIAPEGGMEIKSILGGMLLQEVDPSGVEEANFKFVTTRRPTASEIRDLSFAWKVAKHVKSNAIVLAKGEGTVGIGAGQMSRVDSAKIAIAKAGARATGSCMASDGFIPFKDTVEEAARAGVTAIIQPGGSIRDQEVVQLASQNDMAMVFTGRRCFRH